MREEVLSICRKMQKLDFSKFIQPLSREEFFLLGVLMERGRSEEKEDGMKVSLLADALDVSSPAVSRMIKHMEQKEYVFRNSLKEDRRVILVNVTPTGKQLYERSEHQLNQLLEKVIQRTGKENVDALLCLWNQLTEAFEEELNT